MEKISDVLREVIESNSFLLFGVQARLFNLTQLSRYLNSLISARVGREIADSAILMGLSRLQKKYPTPISEGVLKVQLDNLIVQTNLCVLSFSKKNKVRQEINKFYNKIQSQEGYITLTEGMSEVSIIFDGGQEKLAKQIISDRPTLKHTDVAALGVRFKRSDIELKGLYFSIFQDIYMQGISLIEIGSASTELILFMKEADLHLAFQTLYKRLRLKR